MVGRPGDGNELLVTGASRKPAWQAMTRETAIVTGMTALALLITARARSRSCGSRFVRWIASRRPPPKWRRCRWTATTTRSTPRVPAGDTDPRTEVGLVGDTLNRLLDHVERALADVAASDRRMRQFITDASHELRTPLAAIHGYAELTRQDSSILPETTEYSLARIEAEARRMNSLVSDLLLLARLDEGQDLDTADVDLTDLVIDAVNDAAVSAPDHRWLTRVPDAAVWVRGDHARLHQTIANLLSNARVHTPAGTTVTTGIATRQGRRRLGLRGIDRHRRRPGNRPRAAAALVRAVRPRRQVTVSGGWQLRPRAVHRRLDHRGAQRHHRGRIRQREKQLSK